MLRRKFLIAIDQIARKAYLKSNVVVRREDNVPISLLRQITILPLVAIEHLHAQETQRTHKRKPNICNYVSVREDTTCNMKHEHLSGTIIEVVYY